MKHKKYFNSLNFFGQKKTISLKIDNMRVMSLFFMDFTRLNQTNKLLILKNPK